jgi:peroxiredoxin
MSLTETPVCNFGEKIKNFSLRSTDEKQLTLADIQGPKGTLIMFICNHCPYVQAIMQETVEIVNEIKKLGISSVAIMSNDTLRYQEDSFDNMKLFKKKYNISFPYLFDETQEIAKSYGAVCTPDFFGYNKDGELQYRGRARELKHLTPIMEKESELLLAMKMIASTNKGPLQQYPSMGCNIKWK